MGIFKSIIPLLLAFTALPAIAQASPLAAAEPCPATSMPVAFEFIEMMPDATELYENSRKIEEALAGTANRIAFPRYVDAITLAGMTRRVELSVHPAVTVPGGICAVPAKFSTQIGFPRIVIHMNNRLKFGGCQWDVTRGHEYLHVQLLHEAFDGDMPGYRQAAALQTLTVMPAATEREAETALLDAYLDATRPAFQAMMDHSNQMNASIDTPKEYNRLDRLCPTTD